jgi:hypothetical protein
VAHVASEPGNFRGYRCCRCGTEYPPGPLTYTCPEDGANLDVLLDYAAVARQSSPGDIAASPDGSIWRYLPLLPVEDPGLAGSALRAVGWTPLLQPPGLGESLGLARLYLKDDGRNPTASFKDRASAVVVARAREIGAEVVITASTGNAGAALAGMAAAAKLPAVILAPRSAPQAKIAQLLIFGLRSEPAGSPGLRMVRSQHWLQPLHRRGEEDRLLRDLRAAHRSGDRCEHGWQTGCLVRAGGGVRLSGRRQYHQRAAQGIPGPAGAGLD